MSEEKIHFYGTRAEHGYMSNFARYPVKVDGTLYKTSEHYFQAMKFEGTKWESKVRDAGGPMEAATLGRDRKLPLRKDWESVKDNIMRKVVEAKFRQHPEIAKQLLATGDATLIEDTSSSGDDYWGKVNGKGKNMLGIILMEIRKKLQDESR